MGTVSVEHSFPTARGITFDLDAPTADMIDPFDIAWSLAMTNRYGGHSWLAVNVASHSLNVLRIAGEQFGVTDRQVLLAALLHDAHEAYLGDVIRPLKRMLGETWAAIEARVDTAIADRFGFPVETFGDPKIRQADHIVYGWERRDLVGVSAWDEPHPDDIPAARCPNLVVVPAQQAFMHALGQLGAS